MDNVVLSLDGRKEINDQMRPFRNGTGSYDLIVPKFQKLAESRNQEKYYIRGTFTRNNLDFSNDIMHFADLGFKQMSIEPVVGDESDPYAIREEDLPKIMEEYDKLAKMMIEREKEGKGFNFFHFMIDLMVVRVWQNVYPDAVPEQNIWLLHHGATSIHAISSSDRMTF